MKIVVIGASGKIGSAVAALLATRHEVVAVHRSSEVPVDIEREETVRGLFERVSGVEALVNCSGRNAFGPLAKLSAEDYAASTRSKVLGQVTLVRLAMERLVDGGSITLTSGQHPFEGGAAASLASGALEAFVECAALELPRGLRLNVVSPATVKDAAAVAQVYLAAVEGRMTGKTLPA